MQSSDCHANEPGFPNPDFPTFFFFLFFFFFFFSFFLLLNKFSAAAIFNIAEMYNQFSPPPHPPGRKTGVRSEVSEESERNCYRQDRRIKQNEKELNDLQQYSRRWNLRVFKVPEKEAAGVCDLQ